MSFDPENLWTTYGERVVLGLLNIGAAALTLVIGLWIAAWAAGAIRKFARKHPRVDDTLAAFFSWIVRYGIIGFVLVAVLNRFGVATTSIVAVLGAATLAIGLALQGTLSNLAAGVMLVLFRPYRLGDYVELNGHAGSVRDMTLFTTEIVTPQNIKIVLPNGLCWGAPMINYTAHDSRRLDLEFTVSYDTDLNQAVAVIEEVVANEARVMKSPAANVRVSRLGDFAVFILVRAWIRTGDFLEAKFALTRSVKEALDAAHIVIPFPTATNYEMRLDPPAKQAAAPPPDRA